MPPLVGELQNFRSRKRKFRGGGKPGGILNGPLLVGGTLRNQARAVVLDGVSTNMVPVHRR